LIPPSDDKASQMLEALIGRASKAGGFIIPARGSVRVALANYSGIQGVSFFRPLEGQREQRKICVRIV
jgi:hypothetical protein